ncbi:hypothetical protein PNOK_0978900 [Pyrrhoderma noxium]|uniref:BTB domain-containing protein n=1 Tax=Pyrrhoderma noxium TaxID=2282107 RepID=A0A286U553_9AGAM|nr:hypothetical protein PNOK_0978900 [Pyrrhoderma noxium]
MKTQWTIPQTKNPLCPPSNFRPTSPAPSVIGSLTRISLNHNPALFSNELEYLYTGKGLGDAFEFLFDANKKNASEGEADEARIAKLHVPTIGNSTTTEEETAPGFYSHRFILATRAPYFYDQLITYGLKNLPPPREPAKLRIPSPPFTAPALHFTLGFLYTGTLAFSNRTYDLDTAFAIMSSANYLQIQPLYDEIQARIVVEMMHGLFHAFLEFTEYERITGGKWGNGCRCRQCARRAPRVLQFSVRPDVQNVYLDRGARRALVGLFGSGWVTSEFAELPQKTRDGLLSGVKKRCLPMNVLLMLFAAPAGLKKLSSVQDGWSDTVKDMILTARSFVDSALCSEAEKVFNEKDWVDIMESDGMGRFEDGERVEWVMDSIRRGMNDNNVVKLYQALVSVVLLRPHPQESDKSLLSSTSQIRVQVEQTRLDILRMIRRRWVSIRQEGGFDNMETWVTAEISDEINVPAEDLTTPSGANPRGPMTRTGLRPTLSRVEDVTERDSMSTNHSLRTSVLYKNHTRTGTPSQIQSSSASIRSVARSVASTKSRASSRLTTATERERKESRPDSKFVPFGGRSISPTVNRAPSVNSTHSTMEVDDEDTPSNSRHVSTATSPTLSSARRASITKGHRPRISTTLVTSTRSHASTIRRNTANTVPSSTTQQTLRPPPSPVRSTSSLSNSSLSSPKDDSTSTFRTPRDGMTSRDSIARLRKISTASTTSNVSMGSTGTSRSPRIVTAPSLPKAAVRSRRLSEASVSSTTTAGAARNRRISTTSTTTTVTTATGQKKTMIRKSPSATSLRTTNSTAGSVARKTVVAPGMAKSASGDDRKCLSGTKKTATTTSATMRTPQRNTNGSPNKPLPKSPSKENIDPERTGSTDSNNNKTIKSKSRVEATMKEDKRNVQSPSSDSGSTATRATVRRKGSNDTITLSKKKKAASSTPGKAKTGSSSTPSEEGTLRWFRAFARYIGEVEGETGPWVGVEVPVTGDGWDDQQQSDGRAWHDGSWGGVKYFDVGSYTSEWGDDERLTRRRRNDLSSSFSSQRSHHHHHHHNNNNYGSYHYKGTKREGDTLSIERKKRMRSGSPSVSDVSTAEYRGLFVRPQQVLYVLDAVGDL